jgi:hypothetical protein
MQTILLFKDQQLVRIVGFNTGRPFSSSCNSVGVVLSLKQLCYFENDNPFTYSYSVNVICSLLSSLCSYRYFSFIVHTVSNDTILVSLLGGVHFEARAQNTLRPSPSMCLGFSRGYSTSMTGGQCSYGVLNMH